MKRRHDPLRLDVASFIDGSGSLEGTWAGADLERLAESQAPPQDVALAEVGWQVDGQPLAGAGGPAQRWLALTVESTVWLTCQRCLQPLRLALRTTRRIRFVSDESQAEALDAESEDDILALPRWLNLRELIEDELLLALPLVPRHENICPQPLPNDAAAAPELAQPAEANPFAALQGLKNRGGQRQ